MNRSSDFRLPSINQNSITSSLNPPSLSHQFFNYAKNQLKNGNMNPNGFSLSEQPAWFNPDNNPYKNLFARDGMVYNKIKNNNIIDEYPIPQTLNVSALNEAKLVHFPDETFVPLSKLDKFLNQTKEESNKSIKMKSPQRNDEEYRKKLFNQLEEKNELKRRNRKKWGFIKRSIHILSLYRLLRNFTKSSIDIKSNKLLNIQSAKECLIQIRNFILPVMGNIETFCTEFFHQTLIYNTPDLEKQKNTVFIVKSFIHQFFSDLTSAFAKFDDIPMSIKKIFKMYITEKSVMPFGFLTTFEFNRLEFTQKVELKNMNKERQGMLVCFILLYRVILIDILKRYEKYFPKIRDMKPKEEKIEAKIVKNYNDLQKEKLIQEKRRMDIAKGNIDPNTLEGNQEDTEENRLIRRNIAMKNKNSRRVVMARNTDEKEKKKTSRRKPIPPANPPKKQTGRINKNDNFYEFADDNDKTEIPNIRSPPPKKRKKVSQERRRRRDDEYDRYESQRQSRDSRRNRNQRDNYSKSRAKSGGVSSNSRSMPSRSQSKSTKDLRRSKMRDDDRPIRGRSSKDSRSKSRSKKRINPRSKEGINYMFWGEDLKDVPKKPENKESKEIEEARRAVMLLPNREKMKIIEQEEEKLKMKVSHNINFIINVLHHIFKTAIEENVPIFHETFKEKHCYSLMVYKKSESSYSNQDDVEFVKGVVLSPQVTKDFIRHNYRWLQMYIFNTFQFCVDFARKVYKD